MKVLSRISASHMWAIAIALVALWLGDFPWLHRSVGKLLALMGI